MSAVNSAGLRLTGSVPVGSVDPAAEVLAAGLDSSAGVPGGVVTEGLVVLVVHPAQSIVAARISGSVRRSIIGVPPPSCPLPRASQRGNEKPVRATGRRRVVRTQLSYSS